MVFRQNLNRLLATGHDGLCPRILKECFSQLCHLFHNMIDLLIANSVFPTSLKITSDTPIQGGPCDNPNDFTPVLILPVLSNFIKHHVAKPPLANLQEATWSRKHSLVSVLITSRGRPLSDHWYRVARIICGSQILRFFQRSIKISSREKKLAQTYFPQKLAPG